MIDVLELREGGYNRNKFYEQASKVIKELHAGNRPPIVVGGTNYYIETLLFDIEAGG
jgi:tRNA A37 N6-isopentenylltransferase MiaA